MLKESPSQCRLRSGALFVIEFWIVMPLLHIFTLHDDPACGKNQVSAGVMSFACLFVCLCTNSHFVSERLHQSRHKLL